ncbi:Leucyl/phenylalanyl-tRNA--protein transferase [Caenispirillum salinarum AK4]|uniref:Leucyl/phenylalanyl-tRNA--protein transferase n=1 Tax=Caenispirillum salinarum AK4 TaxID=1238182 RepID=K9HUZ0_9PROT|nr:leucyl/phenylalanyl-tRNA--protein transferase [Caenispirillum salinarum]EKV32076.1 Leucyl/phenylalanyl-tRNA--protein transferase [Caenispirillum salinarum AK4]
MTELPVTPDLLLRAYASGVFPMARSRRGRTLYWVDPDERGIIPLDAFHVPKSLIKTLRRGSFEISVDRDFEGVLEGCAAPAPGRTETWINDKIAELFVDLHGMGYAHSVECRLGGELVGGLYGLRLGSAFFGESMFSRVTDASKVALCHLVARLIGGGFTLLDTQFITEHLERFGAIEIPRAAYHRLLNDALKRQARFDGDYPSARVVSLLKQSSTQTS